MDCIASRKLAIGKHDLLSSFYHGFIHGEYFIDYAEQCVKRRLDRVTAVNCRVTVKDFLENLDISHKPLSVHNELVN